MSSSPYLLLLSSVQGADFKRALERVILGTITKWLRNEHWRESFWVQLQSDFEMSVGRRKFHYSTSLKFSGNSAKHTHLLQSYHSCSSEAQFCSSVFINVSKWRNIYVCNKLLTWRGKRVWGLVPQEKFVKSSPLFWLRMHLPVSSLLWATWNSDIL